MTNVFPSPVPSHTGRGSRRGTWAPRQLTSPVNKQGEHQQASTPPRTAPRGSWEVGFGGCCWQGLGWALSPLKGEADVFPHLSPEQRHSLLHGRVSPEPPGGDGIMWSHVHTFNTNTRLAQTLGLSGQVQTPAERPLCARGLHLRPLIRDVPRKSGSSLPAGDRLCLFVF